MSENQLSALSFLTILTILSIASQVQNPMMYYFTANYISNMQMFFVLNDDFLTFFSYFMVMLLLFPFSCGVHYLLCFAYLQNDLNDPFQYAFWRSNLRVLLKNCTLDSTWTRPVGTKLKVTGHDCCGTRPVPFRTETLYKYTCSWSVALIVH